MLSYTYQRNIYSNSSRVDQINAGSYLEYYSHQIPLYKHSLLFSVSILTSGVDWITAYCCNRKNVPLFSIIRSAREHSNKCITINQKFFANFSEMKLEILILLFVFPSSCFSFSYGDGQIICRSVTLFHSLFVRLYRYNTLVFQSSIPSIFSSNSHIVQSIISCSIEY